MPDSIAGPHINLSYNGGVWSNKGTVAQFKHLHVIEPVDSPVLRNLLGVLLNSGDVGGLGSGFCNSLGWLRAE